MTDTPVTADKAKLLTILAERGLPAKLGATLNYTEWKIHDLLCAAYNLRTAQVAVDVPQHVLRKCGPQFQKIWVTQTARALPGGKTEIVFTLTPEAIKTTLRTAATKDAGIFKAKVDTVPLHESWARYIRRKEKTRDLVDWSKEEKKARAQTAMATQAILDGKTFNAQKDNPWARKHLKNKGQ